MLTNSDNSDQTAQLCSLIGVVTVCHMVVMSYFLMMQISFGIIACSVLMLLPHVLNLLC